MDSPALAPWPGLLERGRRIHPQDAGFPFPRVHPAVPCAALEVEAVAFFQAVSFAAVQLDLDRSLENVEKLLALVCIGLAAACRWRDAEKVWFHGRLAPREKLHAHAGARLQHFPLGGPDAAGIRLRGVEERQNIQAVKLR